MQLKDPTVRQDTALYDLHTARHEGRLKYHETDLVESTTDAVVTLLH